MSRIKFEWDHKKSLINLKKHNVSFEEATTVFYDENSLVIADLEHSQQEDRFIILGLSSSAKMLVVCHCVHDCENIIRIISARTATKNETKQYNRYNKGVFQS